MDQARNGIFKCLPVAKTENIFHTFSAAAAIHLTTLYPLNYFMGLEVSRSESFVDSDESHCNYMDLLTSAKRSLQKYTPALLKDTCIDENKLITEVLERNRRGQKKMIKKIVCPFCFTSVAPQNRSGTRRWDVTNFNRHLIKIHGQHV